MKPVITLICILSTVIFAACGPNLDKSAATTKDDIMKAEKDFEKMAAEKGIAEAFWYYADSNAVIKRGNDSLIVGRDNIRNYYSGEYYKQANVQWTPDFIGVSDNGDMAWTYGKYRWQSTDSSGRAQEFKGVFHTVWKKQKDGSWKYVWD